MANDNGINDNDTNKQNGTAFEQLGEKISELLDFANGKSNVHGVIKRLINSVQELYYTSLEESKATKGSSKGQECQISVAVQTLAESVADSDIGERAAAENSPASQVKEKAPARKNRWRKNKKKPSQVVQTQETVQQNINKSSADPPNDGGWTKVERKRQTEKNRKIAFKPSRPDAIIIKAVGNATYAETLRRVKTSTELKDVGSNINKIRKTAAGDLLLELDRKPAVNITQLQSRFAAVLGEAANVSMLTHREIVEVKDLDEVVSREEICTALSDCIGQGEVSPSMVRSIRKAYGGTRTAVLSLPAGIASKLLQTGKVRIGWVVCRIRPKVSPVMCYKCWEFGHLASKCRSQTDRSKMCIKCGAPDHKARNCESRPKCVFCSSKGETVDASHAAGSFKCPRYKDALKVAMNGKR